MTKPTVTARVALAALGLAGSLVLAEALATLLAPAPAPGASPAIYRASDVPGVGYTLIPSLDTHALGADLRTNALGFRGPAFEPRKTAGGLRIALIGDSHAFGFGVPYDATVGEVLARLLRERLARPVEVLNFGVSGHNARQQLAVLRGIALGFAPDLVILLPCNNDDEPAPFATASGHLSTQPDDTSPPVIRTLAARSALLSSLRRVTSRGSVTLQVGAAAPEPRRDDDAATLDAAVAAPLRQMIHAARQAGARVVLASFAGPLDWRNMFQQTARDQQIPLVELLELFPEAHGWDDLLEKFGLGWDPHLGPEAHRRWAHALADVVVAELAHDCGLDQRPEECRQHAFRRADRPLQGLSAPEIGVRVPTRRLRRG